MIINISFSVIIDGVLGIIISIIIFILYLLFSIISNFTITVDNIFNNKKSINRIFKNIFKEK